MSLYTFKLGTAKLDLSK